MTGAHMLACAATIAAAVWLSGSTTPRAAGIEGLPAEHGAADAWHKLQKLRTTASLMHTTAHPDDEHGGMLALASRGRGVRVSLLTLTRGESGDNAIGPELFDALGLIRTEELLLAGRYYGVDAQYFTRAVDYGFSKRLDEAVAKWGLDAVLRDMVAVIRTERPLVMVSRFQGNPRDGHGQHQAAGLLTMQAFEAAGDARRFPEQVDAGLRPWSPLKLYMGGVRENEDWTLRVDAGQFDPVVGASYAILGRLGLRVQRSQTAGRFNPEPGPSIGYYTRLGDAPARGHREAWFFDGIDTTLPGWYGALRREAPEGAVLLLQAVDDAVVEAMNAFRFTNPPLAAPPLARAMRAVQDARVRLGADPETAFMLDRKAQQIADAMHAALGIRLSAIAQPPGTPEPVGPFSAGPPPLGLVTPGDAFDVRVSFTHRSDAALPASIRLEPNDGRRPWGIPVPRPARSAEPDRPLVEVLPVTVPADAALTMPHVSRSSIQAPQYSVHPSTPAFQPFPEPALDAVVRYHAGGFDFEIRRPVMRLEPDLPYGHQERLLSIVPRVSVSFARTHIAVPLDTGGPVVVGVDVVNHARDASTGHLSLEMPDGWGSSPPEHTFSFARAGESVRKEFHLHAPGLADRRYRVSAIARAGGQVYRQGFSVLRHRDLQPRHLYTDAVAHVRGVDVGIAPGLKVGYVMGIGDDVPASLTQLGVDVRLLGAVELASAPLAELDAIVTGTRAYAVRDDLRTHNRRLLDYVREGGHLIVLYNTPELVPDEHAPYPGQLPGTAEEVSEEDSPVEFLAPDHLVLRSPNRITAADFSGWVEQRGSKFWSAWDARYTPIIATWDAGQPPQPGGWLHARYGRGHYTYFAYALHRQLPYGVPGAYRIVANLLSLGRQRETQ